MLFPKSHYQNDSGGFTQPAHLKIQYNVPVPIDNYLTLEEQKLWTQNNLNNYAALNGFETNGLLSSIESRFMGWYSHNCFEISLNIIKKKDMIAWVLIKIKFLNKSENKTKIQA